MATAAAGLSIDASGTVHTAGWSGIVSSFAPTSAPGLTTAPLIFGVVNSAGGALAGRAAPGELISIYGLNLGPASGTSAQLNSSGYIPTTLAGVQMTINGTLAPLLYVSATQINAVAPIELTAGATVTLRVVTNNVAAPDFRVVVDSADPEVFLNTSGTSAALNQDGTVNSASNPVAPGSYVTVWATGTGITSGGDGEIAQSAQSSCACFVSEALIANGTGMPGETIPVPALNVTYAGASPGLVNGVVQINFQLPTDGSSEFVLTVDGKSSGFFTIAVKAH